ncbi:MAG: UDP-N-acetylglucosamine--N-acetylmuramyl-(pentapeptide) pyrophosphoryl-undecaprenol N-acetylglucosamine transferase [Clostridiales bacterium]|nr:UDP-N-acetylglucosamine--N-acetylmuramyl-(pentapeptide) pyrophosphoryl-undecaprenol N-acetylglucosamine transferase [Clostridiales bacterium]
MNNIVLTGGGTGGHCIPNVALLPYLKSFDNVYYIGSTPIEKNIAIKNGLTYFNVPSQKLVRSFTLKNLSIPFTIIKGIKESKEVLKKLKPKVVFSKGGYVSFPVVVAARSLKIPVVLHESDYSIGLANKLSFKFCDKILTAFPETAKTIKNAEFVGNPIRKFNLNKNQTIYKKQLGLDDKPTILVIGGSLGSKKINEVILSSLENLLPHFNVLHIVGKNNATNISKKGYVQLEFLDDIEKAYSLADVAISRAGANTLFELCSLKIPTLFIPLSNKVSRGDQIENARYFANKNMALTLMEEDLTKENLTEKIFYLYKNRFTFVKNLESLDLLGANQKIANILSSYI